MPLKSHYLCSSVESIIIRHDLCSIQRSVKVSFKEVYAWASVNKPAEFRPSHNTQGLCLMGDAAGFHDSQGPRGLSFATSPGGQG